MGFAGNLSTLSLEEVFQTINRIRGTGVLRLASPIAGRDVVFKEGEIIGVAFRQGEERQALLRRLILQGRIDAAAAAAISSSGQDSSRIIEGIISQGLISVEEVREAIHHQSEDELLNLCTWEYADFVFQDAGPGDPEATQLVDFFAPQALTIGTSSVLMESARRHDEWLRIKAAAPADDAVLGVAAGQEAALAERGKAYPGVAVVPLIDAVRTTADIVFNSAITRLDTMAILTELKRDGLISVLSAEDIVAHGDWRIEQQDFLNAARLFRRALASDSGNKNLHSKLAESLEGLGDNPEAASCFSQLALGWLVEGNQEEALSAALRATSLAPDEPQQRLILVRCLLEHGDKSEAVEELRKVVTRFLQLGQLEDARATCLKILEIDPGNETVRQAMMRIFAAAEHEQESEDVMVCASCGHVNEREALICTGCGAGLRLTCPGCDRVVAVSDRLCVFCGMDPQADGLRRAPAAPATARVGKSGSGPQTAKPGTSPLQAKELKGKLTTERIGIKGLKAALEDNETLAIQYERAGQVLDALAAWREVAKYKVDDAELRLRIRDLEAKVHDYTIEQDIQNGHRLRRVRRYWTSLRTYKRALRAMAIDDRRVAPLQALIVATEKIHLRVSAIYAVAGVALLILAVLVALPRVRNHHFALEVENLCAGIEGMAQAKPAEVLAGLPRLEESLAGLDQRISGLSRHEVSKAGVELAACRVRVESTRANAVRNLLKEARQAVDQSDAVAAERVFSALGSLTLRPPYDREAKDLQERISQIKVTQADRHKLRQNAAKMLIAAKDDEANKQFATALGTFRILSDLEVEQSAEAREAVLRLGKAREIFLSRWNAVTATATKDLIKAGSELDLLAAGAESWQFKDELTQRRESIKNTLAAAAADWQQIPAHTSANILEDFRIKYFNTPQAGRAKERLDALHLAQQARSGQRESYELALREKRYDEAWQKATSLAAKGEAVPLPLWIETLPVGAEVRLGNQLKGKTPCLLLLSAEQKEALVLVSPGWKPISRAWAEAQVDWRWQAALTREERWSVKLGKAVGMIVPVPDGNLLVQGGDTLTLLERGGNQRWACNLGGSDDLTDSEHVAIPHTPLLLTEGGFALGLPGGGAALIDAQGNLGTRWPSRDRVRGRPVLYSNEILGGGQRLAIAAEALWCGPLGGDAQKIILPAPAFSGPVVVNKDLDRLLVVATSRGHLIAFAESTRRQVWNHDLMAGQFSQLIPMPDNQAMMVVGETKLTCYQLGANGMTIRWQHPLGAPVVGDPVLTEKTILVTAGKTVRWFGTDGSQGKTLALPEVAGTMPATAGDVVAVGCRNGMLAVFRRGEAAWSTPCPAQPVAVVCTADEIIVGCADGTVVAYAP